MSTSEFFCMAAKHGWLKATVSENLRILQKHKANSSFTPSSPPMRYTGFCISTQDWTFAQTQKNNLAGVYNSTTWWFPARTTCYASTGVKKLKLSEKHFKYLNTDANLYKVFYILNCFHTVFKLIILRIMCSFNISWASSREKQIFKTELNVLKRRHLHY